MKIKKTLFLCILLLANIAVLTWSFSFGPVGAIKKKSEKLKDKIEQYEEEEEAEETYTDDKTGLMWVKDGNSAGCNNGNTLTWEAALTFCEGLSFAGYSDWRLPNVRELESIVDAEKQSPAINTTYFPNTKIRYYWTSTTYVPGPSDAWYVHFTNGYVGNTLKSNSKYVRPVRAGP